LIYTLHKNHIIYKRTSLIGNIFLTNEYINWIVSSDKFNGKVKKIAEGLAMGPALAIYRTKSLLNQTYDHSLVDHIEVERLTQVENATSKEFEEGLKAFIEKRKPKFKHC